METFVALVLMSAYSGSFVTGQPCANATRRVADVCSTESMQQADGQNNIILKADSKQNCSCKLFISQQTNDWNITFRKYDNSSSSQQTSNGCGLLVHFLFNNDLFYSAECAMGYRKYLLSKGNTIDIITVKANGTLPEGFGYCIEIVNEASSTADKLTLECKLHAYESTTSLQPVSTDTSSSDYTEIQRDYITTSTSPTYLTYPSLQTLDEGSFDPVTSVAVGISVGCFCLVLLTGGVIVICIRRRGKWHSKQRNWQTREQPPNKIDNSGNVSDEGMQCNILYSMAFQVNQVEWNTSENGVRSSVQVKDTTTKSEVDKTIDFRIDKELMEKSVENDITNSKENKVIELNLDDKTVDVHDGNYSAIDTDANCSKADELIDMYEAVDLSCGDYSPVNLDGIRILSMENINMPNRTSLGSTKQILSSANYNEDVTETNDECIHLNDKKEEDSSNNVSDSDTHVYAVPDKRRVKHLISPYGSEYAVIDK